MTDIVFFRPARRRRVDSPAAGGQPRHQAETRPAKENAMSTKTILIVLALVAVCAIIVFFMSSTQDKPTAPDGADKQVAPAPSGMRQPPAPAARNVPQVPITVDGRADDWSNAPAFLTTDRNRRRSRNYGCRAVKVARDAENLYVLLILSRGIREKFDAERTSRRGRVSSSALGYLGLQTEDKKFSIWIPTGFSLTYEARKLKKVVPTVDFTVSLHDPAADRYDEIFTAESLKNPQFIGFEGKFLELKIPLDKLGISAREPMKLDLDEM